MRASERCYANVAGYEGFVPHPYPDNHGNVTIGYGSCYYPDGRRVTMKDNVVSRETAWKMMTLTVDRMAARVSKFIQVPVTQNQFDALLSLCYNAGEERICHSTLMRKLNARNYRGAADQFLLWDHSGGAVDPVLHRRRVSERALFLS